MSCSYRVCPKIVDSQSNPPRTKYYAVPVHSGEVNLKSLAQQLADSSTLSEADVIATIVGMVQLVELHLHDGKHVRLDGLGLFSLSATSPGFDTPEECTPRHVSANKICFRADNGLKRGLKKVKFERDKT